MSDITTEAPTENTDVGPNVHQPRNFSSSEGYLIRRKGNHSRSFGTHPQWVGLGTTRQAKSLPHSSEDCSKIEAPLDRRPGDCGRVSARSKKFGGIFYLNRKRMLFSG